MPSSSHNEIGETSAYQILHREQKRSSWIETSTISKAVNVLWHANGTRVFLRRHVPHSLTKNAKRQTKSYPQLETHTFQNLHSETMINSNVSSSNTQISNRKRPRVTFNEIVKVSSAPVPFDQRPRTWYNRAELKGFQLHVRDFVLGIPNEMNTETRGYERYNNPERAENKTLALKCVMLAIRKGMNDDMVAAIAEKSSEWSRTVAFTEACKDFCDVYHPELVGLVPGIDKLTCSNAGSAAANNNVYKKRTISASPSMERRVRARTA